jgi:hypothetical protein
MYIKSSARRDVFAKVGRAARLRKRVAVRNLHRRAAVASRAINLSKVANFSFCSAGDPVGDGCRARDGSWREIDGKTFGSRDSAGKRMKY